MTIKAKQTVVEIISILFIVLFVYAAVSKWMDFSRFSVQIGQSPLLTGFTKWLVWVIPGIEIIISCLLFTDLFRTMGLYISLSMMTLFTSYIIVITQFSDFVPCSCGGILQNMSWTQHLIFNIFFTAIAVIGIFIQSKLYKKGKHLLQ